MKEVKIIIDGVLHEYTKDVEIGGCTGCSMDKHCTRRPGGSLWNLCQSLRLTQIFEPCFKYGNFKIVEQ